MTIKIYFVVYEPGTHAQVKIFDRKEEVNQVSFQFPTCYVQGFSQLNDSGFNLNQWYVMQTCICFNI